VDLFKAHIVTDCLQASCQNDEGCDVMASGYCVTYITGYLLWQLRWAAAGLFANGQTRNKIRNV